MGFADLVLGSLLAVFAVQGESKTSGAHFIVLTPRGAYAPGAHFIVSAGDASIQLLLLLLLLLRIVEFCFQF